MTFDGLLSQSPFVSMIDLILKTLEEKLGTPVDLEFAHDGTHFYLLQCRPQSHALVTGSTPRFRKTFHRSGWSLRQIVMSPMVACRM